MRNDSAASRRTSSRVVAARNRCAVTLVRRAHGLAASATLVCPGVARRSLPPRGDPKKKATRRCRAPLLRISTRAHALPLATSQPGYTVVGWY